MTSYRRRLERDVDAWISRGLVAAENREAILGSASEGRRLDAATVLGIIGGLLAGVAVIAFVAANWSVIPRIGRFAMVLAAFLGAAGGAAWAAGQGREVTRQVLLCIAALVFAAAIGLTGQIFDIAGDAQAALRGAGLAAVALAVAGASPWAAAVGLLLLGLGDFQGPWMSGSRADWPGWLVLAAPLAAAAALRWRSAPLAHAAGLCLVLTVLTLGEAARSNAEQAFLGAAAVLAIGAAGMRSMRDRFEAPAGVLYGWCVWGALIWFGAAGFGEQMRGVLHSVVWLGMSAGVVVLGRHDRSSAITAAGVIGLFVAGATLLFNLGVGLLTSAMVFGLLAAASLVIAFIIRRGKAA